jgi:hypothetical protein
LLVLPLLLLDLLPDDSDDDSDECGGTEVMKVVASVNID